VSGTLAVLGVGLLGFWLSWATFGRLTILQGGQGEVVGAGVLRAAFPSSAAGRVQRGQAAAFRVHGASLDDAEVRAVVDSVRREGDQLIAVLKIGDDEVAAPATGTFGTAEIVVGEESPGALLLRLLDRRVNARGSEPGDSR
jgi:DNA segregation ATPase FtsK/SpoIIIE-like protein